MYKAINRDTGDEIVLLHPKWKDEIKQLRRWSRANILLCQACGQPVRVRAGEIRQRHFAHKHLENCPYKYETPALVNARRVLYEWLRAKFGDGVTLEKMVRDSALHRHIDCWVEFNGKSFAYWIFEGTMKPPLREVVARELENLATHTNWVFLAAVLRRDEDDSTRVHLTTTERDFLQQSDYDVTLDFYAPNRGHTLHYLDAEREELITFRNLRLVHEPQMFQGEPYLGELPSILVSPKNGEFVYPGEHEKLRQYEAEKADRENRQPRAPQLPRHIVSHTERFVPALMSETIPNKRAFRDEAIAAVPQATQEEALCIFCGKWTRNWWSFDGATKTCKCRECYDKGRA